jgi:ElaB/YqjD/DUF883 family membrane-anchored ribosome-binding protein
MSRDIDTPRSYAALDWQADNPDADAVVNLGFAQRLEREVNELLEPLWEIINYRGTPAGPEFRILQGRARSALGKIKAPLERPSQNCQKEKL